MHFTLYILFTQTLLGFVVMLIHLLPHIWARVGGGGGLLFHILLLNMDVFAGFQCRRGSLHVCMCVLLERCAYVASPCHICVEIHIGEEGEYLLVSTIWGGRRAKEYSMKLKGG